MKKRLAEELERLIQKGTLKQKGSCFKRTGIPRKQKKMGNLKRRHLKECWNEEGC